MTGATYWRKVGSMEIGAYTDNRGNTFIVARGQTLSSNVDEVCTALRAVAICIEQQPAGDGEHPQGVLVT